MVVTVHAPSRGGIIASQCSNLRSPMLNSLREWGERRSTFRAGLYCNNGLRNRFLVHLIQGRLNSCFRFSVFSLHGIG